MSLFLILCLLQPEAQYQIAIAQTIDADVEVVLWDRTRCDLVTAQYAIEVDFAAKWAEAIGQALYYAEVLGKKPAIYLIAGRGDERYVYRCMVVGAKHGIRVHVWPR